MLDHSSAHWVRIGRVTDVGDQRCAQRWGREDQSAVKVRPVVQSLVQSVKLRTSDASRGVCCCSSAKKSQRVENTALGVHDDFVSHAVLRITLFEDFVVDDILQCSRDVVRGILRQISQCHLRRVDTEMRDPPSRGPHEQTVKGFRVELHLSQALTSSCRTSRIV